MRRKSNLKEALEFILNALGEMSGTMFAANFILFFSLWKPRVSCIILEVILDALDIFLNILCTFNLHPLSTENHSTVFQLHYYC